MSTVDRIFDRLRARFDDPSAAYVSVPRRPRVELASPDRWLELAGVLHGDADLQFDWLRCLTGLDYAADGKMCVTYDLWSTALRHDLAVKVFCDRAAPAIASVAHLWRAADWHEREAYDLLGIRFVGHPDLRRILMADDWEGHPLRKDYVYPHEYHGIPGSVELDWQQKT